MKSSPLSINQWRHWWRHNGERELRDLLLIWWDPIEVYGEPEALDEYDSYVAAVGKMLHGGARAPAVESYLREVETRDITLAGDANVAARKVLEWHDRVLDRIDRWPPDAPA